MAGKTLGGMVCEVMCNLVGQDVCEACVILNGVKDPSENEDPASIGRKEC